jgi:preprotein translocase subunit SecD
LTQFETELTDSKHFNKRTLEAALKELRFIKEANEFHQNYGLEHLQQRVAEMYQSLQKEIVEFKQLEKDKLNAAKEAEKTEQLKLEKEKAEAEAKKAMAQNIAIKEKRLAIAEEKKRKIAEKEAIEAKRIQQEEEAEIQAKQAEIERQKKLQDSYIELQLEEKIKSMNPETLLNLALEQIEKADSLSFMQGDLLQRIETLIQRHKPN